jgi:hypothetical protein
MDFRVAASESVKALASGNIAAAERLALFALMGDARNATAMTVLGRIAIAVGRGDKAREWLGAALKGNPFAKDAKAAMGEASAMAEVVLPSPGEHGILLMREWGEGFWSDVDQVVGGCLLSEVLGRRAVVWWGENSRFGGGAGSTDNVWDHYFEPVSDATMEDARAAQGEAFHERWRGIPLDGPLPARWEGEGSRITSVRMLGRRERLVVNDFHSQVVCVKPWLFAGHPLIEKSLPDTHRALYAKYIRPRERFHARAQEFFDQHLAGSPTLAVHIRGTDKLKEAGFAPELAQQFEGYIPAALERMPDLRVFLLTDSSEIAGRLKERCGSRLVLTPSTRADGDTGLHFREDRSGRRLGEEVLTDCLIATRCDRFLGMAASNVAAAIAVLRDWAPETCEMVGPYVHAQPAMLVLW